MGYALCYSAYASSMQWCKVEQGSRKECLVHEISRGWVMSDGWRCCWVKRMEISKQRDKWQSPLVSV
jgi:hypothetical protein